MENDGCLTALYVEPELGDDAREVGALHLTAALRRAGIQTETSWVEPRVEVTNNVTGAIAKVAGENYDLLLVGASDRGFMQRMLFGTVSDRLLHKPEGMAIAVLRRARPMSTRIREGLEAWLDLRIPQLPREERVELYERLQQGARWNFDFMAMMCLATTIAALGLIQNSTAVVIGAMLVAPLMTPLIAAGLALVQGNTLLVLSAVRSVVYGFFLALGIGFVCGLAMPMRELTNELAARSAPNLIDMAIAFVSGLAAAFAMARPNLSAALPGVAIAAALVPPLATTGIALAYGQAAVALGAAELFTTNVVAIILGASANFYASGIRSTVKGGRRRIWAKRAVQGLILACATLAVPLSSAVVSHLTQAYHQRQLPTTLIEERLRESLQGGGAELVSMRLVSESRREIIVLDVRSAVPLSPVVTQYLVDLASATAKRPVRLRLRTQLFQQVDSNEESL